MFYIKTREPGARVVRTEITDENVYTRCPDCGRELPIDLAEVFSDGEGDLFSTSIICSACTQKRGKRRTHLAGLKISIDGLALLSDTLCHAGYGEEVRGVFDDFEIESISDLDPEQYEAFANTLKSLAAEGSGE